MLLDATRSLLREKGVEAFSMRECARRAGVSHAAPAHHFDDVRGLLTAFAVEGYVQLVQSIRRRVRGKEADPVQRLDAVCRAYIDFALKHAEHFRLMFRRDILNVADPDLMKNSRDLADRLGSAIGQAIGSNVPESEWPSRLMLAWSAIHGYAVLSLEYGSGRAGVRPYFPPGNPSIDDMLKALVRSVTEVAPASLTPSDASR